MMAGGLRLQSCSAVIGRLIDLAGAASGVRSAAGAPSPTPPSTADPAGPPGRRSLAFETLGALQVPRLALATPRLWRVPRGDGGAVVDIPGWRAPESSMAPLRSYLRRLGYDARTWGLGTNTGDPERDVERMLDGVRDLAGESGRPVRLVGWSLGGVIAREVARKLPEEVERVVTYGTPVIGGPAHTVAATRYEPGEGERIDAIVADLNSTEPIRAPITAIYTRRDGVVSWRACIDRDSPLVEHVEVASTHLGLGIDPDVWEIVARRLALSSAGSPV